MNIKEGRLILTAPLSFDRNPDFQELFFLLPLDKILEWFTF